MSRPGIVARAIGVARALAWFAFGNLRGTDRWGQGHRFDFRTLIHARARGNCLAPYFNDGDMFFVARELTPHHGELVEVQIGYKQSSSGGLLIGGTSGVVWRNSVKQYLVDDAGEGWLANAVDDFAVPARLHRVLGVVVAYQRRRHWLRPSVKRMDFSAKIARREAEVIAAALPQACDSELDGMAALERHAAVMAAKQIKARR